MENKGPFAKAFMIAIPFFVLNLIPALASGGADSSYESGYTTGYILSRHVMSAIVAGLLGKFAFKGASWLKMTLIYSVVLIGLSVLQFIGGQS